MLSGGFQGGTQGQGPLGVFTTNISFHSDIAILQEQMTYPEFKDRLLEDIPYEEYTAAMNGFVKYVVSRCFITRSDPSRSGGIRFRGKEYA